MRIAHASYPVSRETSSQQRIPWIPHRHLKSFHVKQRVYSAIRISRTTIFTPFHVKHVGYQNGEVNDQ